jgi:hypothetical protein
MKHAVLQDAAFEAYAGQDFDETVRLLTDLINYEPTPSPRWLEMRAQVHVKIFGSAELHSLYDYPHVPQGFGGPERL